jgi:large subunit ribosomal protein L16
MLFEMAGVSEELAREAMRLAQYKLPISTRFVNRKDQEAAKAAVEVAEENNDGE